MVCVLHSHFDDSKQEIKKEKFLFVAIYMYFLGNFQGAKCPLPYKNLSNVEVGLCGYSKEAAARQPHTDLAIL